MLSVDHVPEGSERNRAQCVDVVLVHGGPDLYWCYIYTIGLYDAPEKKIGQPHPWRGLGALGPNRGVSGKKATQC
jgi:hypothetical protein